MSYDKMKLKLAYAMTKTATQPEYVDSLHKNQLNY